MSSCSYIALLINYEQGAQNHEKEVNSKWWLLKQAKRHKRRNFYIH